MILIAEYEKAIACGDIQDDPLQRQVLVSMQRLANDLKLKKRFWLRPWRKCSTLGLYLYGPVGVGKTYLMDLLYQSIDETQKARFHFHHFMQQIDAQLRRLQGHKNPLRYIVANLAKKIRVLCFDEFLIYDVAYAMILGELLQALFEKEIILVVTANTCPDDLYLNGVRRERFLPAIDLIKAHCEVVYLNDKNDYRLGRKPSFDAYLCPLGAATDQALATHFTALLHEGQEVTEMGTLSVQNRDIAFIKRSDRVIWFDFKVICTIPRSQLDYLELAERFDTVFVSNIPRLAENDTIYVLLWIHFIDVLYDRGIHLIISAAVPLEQLYVSGEMSQEFKRTRSRLEEMQSADYLKRHPHRLMSTLID